MLLNSAVRLRVVPNIWRRSFAISKGSFATEHLHFLKMPAIMDAKEGVVDKWLKRQGDSFSSGESICEVSLSDFSLAVDIPSAGIITELIVPAGGTVEAEHPIASYVLNKEEYMSYIESKRLLIEDSERMADTIAVQEEKTKKPDTTVMMREIKHMIQQGTIEEGSDFAKKLQSLARKGNEELLSIFIASFDGSSFNSGTFDVKFFLENARDIVSEAEQQAATPATTST